MTLIGLATAGGAPVAGAEVRAYVGDVLCGAATTWNGSVFNFNLQVRSASQQPGCGTAGATVTFTVDGVPASGVITFTGGATLQVTIAAP